MGLSDVGIRFLLYAKTQGVLFERTAMLGRQRLRVDADNLKAHLTRFGSPCTIADARRLLEEQNRYAEPLLRTLGAESIRSFDASNYEQATDVVDLNAPLDAAWHRQFSVVLDGGTLEHIFNFPVAIRNCMEMVKVGGHFLAITPANNFVGHGLYQFSPELFFRIFDPANGFEVTRLIAAEAHASASWFTVADPQHARTRVSFVNAEPTYLLVIAKRIADRPVFERVPQQSDYLSLWNAGQARDAQGGPVRANPRFSFLRRLLGPADLPLRRAFRRLQKRKLRGLGSNPALFVPLDLP